MRRDYFTLTVQGLEWLDADRDPEKPTLVINFEGPESLLGERITRTDGDILDESEVDISFRFQTEINSKKATGVVSVTDRITGDFILELNEDATKILEFIRVARTFGKRSNNSDDRYQITIRNDDGEILTYNKRTFLVYDRAGNLIRQYSLIPSGIEL